MHMADHSEQLHLTPEWSSDFDRSNRVWQSWSGLDRPVSLINQGVGSLRKGAELGETPIRGRSVHGRRRKFLIKKFWENWRKGQTSPAFRHQPILSNNPQSTPTCSRPNSSQAIKTIFSNLPWLLAPVYFVEQPLRNPTPIQGWDNPQVVKTIPFQTRLSVGCITVNRPTRWRNAPSLSC